MGNKTFVCIMCKVTTFKRNGRQNQSLIKLPTNFSIMLENHKESSYTIDIPDRVYAVRFSPFKWCGQLLAICTTTRIIIGKCIFPEEDLDTKDVEFEILQEFHHGCQARSFVWSPETTLSTIPKVLRFAVIGGDKVIRIYTSDLRQEASIQIIDGHLDYINDAVFDPDKGDQLASVSDDYTCRIWDLDGNQKVCFPLGAAGMSVCWHSDDPAKLMIALKNGIIRFYNLLSGRPIMSLDCGEMPLMAADWCLGNGLRVGAVAGGEWFMWDTSRSSRPLETRQAHNICSAFRWAASNGNLLATVGQPGNQIKVFHTKLSQVVVSSSLQVFGGISWHYKSSILAAGGDGKVHFWVIDSI